MSGISVLAGIPGGVAIFGTVPSDARSIFCTYHSYNSKIDVFIWLGRYFKGKW
ncbi:hypothetical protein R2R32_13930 [Clostridium perfringens]|nr:hypothetical protein [Clostridium perfringens]